MLFRFKLGAVCALAVAGPASAEVEPTDVPFLWMIEATPPSFLYGTIHVPDERVTTLPAVVLDAFEASDVVYTEIPMDPATQMEAAMAFMLTERTLQDMVSEELWERLDAFLEKRGMAASMLNQLSPTAVAIQLMMVDDMATFMSSQPLDALLESRAKEAGKTTRALETLDEQMSIFTSLTDEEQVEMLDDTLTEFEKFDAEERSILEELVTSYLAGDMGALSTLTYQFMNPEDDFDRKLIHALITERNLRMADRIQARLAEEPDRVHFFAVGTLHFPRPDGILALLRDRGFEIDRLLARDRQKLADELAVGAN